jgi:tRNA(Met) C34 N-acetyltransferase TmcA
VTFLDAASEKTLRSTVALTASRGRGKSAALGLAIAGALALGYSNIFVTAPSPENLKTLFEFVCKVRPGLEPRHVLRQSPEVSQLARVHLVRDCPAPECLHVFLSQHSERLSPSA